MHKPLQNTFKENDRDKYLIDFRKQNLWMHSIERPESSLRADRASGIALIIATVVVLGMIMYAVKQFPKAYPNNVTVNK